MNAIATEQKRIVRCTIRKVLSQGVEDNDIDRARARNEIRQALLGGQIPVLSGPRVLFIPDYHGFGPMWHGEVGVIFDGKAEFVEDMVKWRRR
jgi:hypothetical protein